jgi:hypothetical protein
VHAQGMLLLWKSTLSWTAMWWLLRWRPLVGAVRALVFFAVALVSTCLGACVCACDVQRSSSGRVVSCPTCWRFHTAECWLAWLQETAECFCALHDRCIACFGGCWAHQQNVCRNVGWYRLRLVTHTVQLLRRLPSCGDMSRVFFKLLLAPKWSLDVGAPFALLPCFSVLCGTASYRNLRAGAACMWLDIHTAWSCLGTLQICWSGLDRSEWVLQLAAQQQQYSYIPAVLHGVGALFACSGVSATNCVSLSNAVCMPAVQLGMLC